MSFSFDSEEFEKGEKPKFSIRQIVREHSKIIFAITLLGAVWWFRWGTTLATNEFFKLLSRWMWR